MLVAEGKQLSELEQHGELKKGNVRLYTNRMLTLSEVGQVRTALLDGVRYDARVMIIEYKRMQGSDIAGLPIGDTVIGWQLFKDNGHAHLLPFGILGLLLLLFRKK